MHGRALLLVALAVVAAGCGGFVGSDEPSPTLTPAPIPTQPPTTDRPGSTLAPGLTAGAVTDAGLLADNHARITRNLTYRWRERVRQYRLVDGRRFLTGASVTVYVTNGSRFYQRTRYVEPASQSGYRRNLTFESFGNASATYTMYDAPDVPPTYGREAWRASNGEYPDMAAESVERYLAVGSARVVRADGSETGLYVVAGSRDRLPFGNVTEYRAEAIVRKDGFVRRLSANYSLPRIGGTTRVEYSFEYERVGTATVPTPEWVTNASLAVSGTTDENESAGGYEPDIATVP